MNAAPSSSALANDSHAAVIGSSALFGLAPFHLVALSGGKDSTALALELRERHPEIAFRYYITPTGWELPEMFDWWEELGKRLGSKIIPVMHTSLGECIRNNKMLPNFRARFCTRQIKIEPARKMMAALAAQGEVNHYVGLRADEETRLGGIFDDIGIVNRHPFREWGWGVNEVWKCLQSHGLAERIPERTDCDVCYHQQIGEWWRLWTNHPDRWMRGENLEIEVGGTFRTPGRDTWPTSMRELREAFESGRIPKSERQPELFTRGTMTGGACRVCSL